MPDARHLLRTYSFAFAAALSVVLFIANVLVQPSFAAPGNWDETLGSFAPLALVAMASTPSVLSGGGGLDISIGPLMNFISIIFVTELLGTWAGGPEIAIPILLVIGAAVGAVNGILVTVLRYQPVISTLCVLFVLGGVNLSLAPSPKQAPANWTENLSGSIGPIPGGLIMIAAVLLAWLLLRRTPLLRTLYAVGGDDAAAYASGIDVTAVRIIAYSIGGAFAAVAGLALAGLIASADPTYGVQYALIGLAAVALGGTPIGGGRGGIVGSLLGAAAIYLIRNLLVVSHVSVVWLQVVYGTLLIAGMVLSAMLVAQPRLRGAR